MAAAWGKWFLMHTQPSKHQCLKSCCTPAPRPLPPPALVLQICPAQAITIETEEREDGSRKTTR